MHTRSPHLNCFEVFSFSSTAVFVLCELVSWVSTAELVFDCAVLANTFGAGIKDCLTFRDASSLSGIWKARVDAGC